MKKLAIAFASVAALALTACGPTQSEECAKYVISPPLRAVTDRDALWQGLADGSLSVVSTDHVPDRMATDKDWHASFDQISNGGPSTRR